MASGNARGERLIPIVIDDYAKKEPGRVWVSIPRNETALVEGYEDITYKQFANAINHAAWWLEHALSGCGESSQTFAYAGPKDLRYPILAVAAVKAGRPILLPSPFATKEAQLNLLDTTKATTYLHTEYNGAAVKSITSERPGVQAIPVPELGQWLCDQDARHYEYSKTWDEAKSEPWIIFHTSGTTGLPQPVVYTNLMMTSLDATLAMPEAKQEIQTHHYMSERLYSPLPALHFVGMTTALQMTVLLGTIMVLGPADQPATAKIADQVLRYGNVTAAVLPPYLLEDLCRNPTTLKHVQRLKYIHYAGAPLSQDAGDAISRHTKLVSAMGSTEAGPYFVNIHDEIETAWNYHSFCPSIGLEMEYRTKDLYEPVFRKQKALARWQQIFHVYPELDTFYTKDLMRKHPTEPNLWVYAGRTDDLVILSLGECLYASSMESAVQNHPRVRSAIIGGEGRKKPFLILELMREDGQPGTGVSNPELLDQIWPAVQEANEQCSEPVRLSRELTMLAKADKPFRRTAKGTVARRDTLAFYKDEVDALYRSEDVAAVWSRTT